MKAEMNEEQKGCETGVGGRQRLKIDEDDVRKAEAEE
jgi:hypothetical protein